MNEKNTIVIFSTAYLPFVGGAEVAIKEITDRVSDFHFVLVTARMRRDLPKRERMHHVDVYRVGMGISVLDKMLSPLLGAWRVYRITRHARVCLFWSMMVSYVTITPVLLQMFGFFLNIPILLTLQEGDSPARIHKGRFGLIAFWWRAALRRASRVQVISRYLETLARQFGYRGAVSMIPNGVDIKKFSIFNFQFSKIKEHKIIITVSRLVEKNGIDVLVNAFSIMYKKFPDAKLHIVGDGELRTELEALTRNVGVARAVTFFGSESNEKIPRFLAEADIFVRPSRSEGLGISFLEAMAAGVPVIATPVGGIVDFLRDGETGLFCKVDDPHDLALRMEKLFDDEVLCAKLKENGRRLVENTYDWNAIAQRMKTIFNDLCVS